MATNDKYDRQLRLWGAQGQRALGETRVISVGASSAGTETLKNLVLPGVGAFTVMDFVDETAAAAAAAAALDGDNCSDNNSSNSNGRSSPSSVATTGKITDHDVSSNFFLTKENATKAEGAYKHLKELNPDVSGSYRNITVSLNAASNKEEGPDTPGYWKRILEEEFLRGEETETEATESGEADTAMEAEAKLRPKNLLVVASDVLPSILEALADACWEAGHPLIVVISYGLIGSVRLQLPKKGAVLLQPKPTSSPPDLRLVTSFPAFREFVDSVVGGDSLQQMDSQQHGHVPYPVLLAKAIDNYHETKSKEAIEGGNCNSNSNNQRILPKSFAEKRDFVNNYVKPMARDYNLQLNFQEAVSNAYLAYTEQDIGWKDSPTNISKESKLGQLESALETFIREHPDHRPPLNGSVPDMTASTALYVRLQQLYRDQAEEDLKIMTEILRNTQEQQERDGNGGAAGALESVTDDDIANFCANVYSVGHIKTRSLLEEYHGSASSNDNNNDNNIEELVDDWKMALMDPYDVPVHTPFLWYLGVRAAQIFCHREGRYPGCIVACSNGNDNQLEEDAALLSEILKDTVIPHYKLSDEVLLLNNVDSICKELTRYGNAEIHTVASVVGGVASQEAVKIVTGQYIPLDNTYVYNGIASVGGVYKF